MEVAVEEVEVILCVLKLDVGVVIVPVVCV
jgi:hypothetical protein